MENHFLEVIIISLWYRLSYLTSKICIVKQEGLNGESVNKKAKVTVSNDSNIDILNGSLTNLAIVNSTMENRNKNNEIDTQLQYDNGARYAVKL